MLNRMKKRDYNTKPTAVGKSLSSAGRFYTSWNLWAECWHRNASLNQIIIFLWRRKWPSLYPCVATTWGECDLGKIPIAKEVLWCLSQRTQLPAPLQLELAQVATLAWKTNQPHDRDGEPLTSCAVAWASQQCETCASWKPWQPEIYFKNKEVLGFWQRIQQLLQGVSVLSSCVPHQTWARFSLCPAAE